MIGHRILSALIAWLKTAISGLVFFSLSMILLSGMMHTIHRTYEVILFSLLNFLIFGISSAIYLSFFLIPLSFIDSKAFKSLRAMDLAGRYLPIISFLFVILLIPLFSFYRYINLSGGEAIVIFMNLYNMTHVGLLFFIYTAKKRESKLKGTQVNGDIR